MSKNTCINLGEHFDNFISRQVDSGRYASASEVIRDALRLLENQNKKLETLRQLLIDGEESGHADYQPRLGDEAESFAEDVRMAHSNDSLPDSSWD